MLSVKMGSLTGHKQYLRGARAKQEVCPPTVSCQKLWMRQKSKKQTTYQLIHRQYSAVVAVSRQQPSLRSVWAAH